MQMNNTGGLFLSASRAALVLELACALGPEMAVAQPGGKSGPPPAKVVVDVARTQRLESRREVVGELRAVQRSQIAAQRAGLVVAVLIEPGDAVRKGDIIARLDDAIANLDKARAGAVVKQRQAVIHEREAALVKTQRDVRRLEELSRRGSASENELDDAMTSVAEAQARLAQAQADLSAAQTDVNLAIERLADMVIVAPFNGSVVEKRTELGQWAREGDVVADLVALDPIDAFLEVPQALAVRLLQTDAHQMQVRDEATGAVHPSEAFSVSPVADTLSRNVEVRIRLRNPAGTLRPGMSVIGLIPTGAFQDTVTVPKDAILRDDAGAFVYTVRDNVAIPVRVRPRFGVGNQIAVSAAGLAPGAQVVIEGNERLFPGQRVAPTRVATKAAKASAAREDTTAPAPVVRGRKRSEG